MVIKHERRRSKIQYNTDTDAYLIRHGNVLIEAECEFTVNSSDSLFTCDVPVGKPLSMRTTHESGKPELVYSAHENSETRLAVLSEETN